ncbi:MAG: hypothetical protein IPJ30_12560 [Acidobacteria bacterium]|nr:hypothetical protein [Acidobacteriota bacterium]
MAQIQTKTYQQLLSRKRRKDREETYTLAEDSESDRGRVVYSKAFRRLGAKTQVFPLDGNAAVRVRMTHSLEVAHLGRQIAERIILKLGDHADLFGLEEP